MDRDIASYIESSRDWRTKGVHGRMAVLQDLDFVFRKADAAFLDAP